MLASGLLHWDQVAQATFAVFGYGTIGSFFYAKTASRPPGVENPSTREIFWEHFKWAMLINLFFALIVFTTGVWNSR